MNEAVKVLVPLAQGCEELEAITIIDLLRRASFDVTTAGLDNQPVKASRGTVLIPDMDLTQALLDKYHLFVMPGGYRAPITWQTMSESSLLSKTWLRPTSMLPLSARHPRYWQKPAS